MVSTYPTGPATPFEKLQADLKRKAAQLDAADNQLSLLKNENAALKAAKAELEQAFRRDRTQANDLNVALAKAQALLKQRDAALAALGQQLEASKARHSGSGGLGSGPVTPAVAAVAAAGTPQGPLSRQNSDEEALVAELTHKTARIAELEQELAEARARPAVLTPRQRESVEGVAAVGSGGMTAYDANRLRTLRAEVETWKDRSENLVAQLREAQRAQGASDLEKVQLADTASRLSEKVAELEEQLRAAREGLASLRAVADQGRQELKSQLQRKDSDLGRAVAAQEVQAALVDELKAALDKGSQERERLVMQAQHLQAQLAKAGDEVREGNQRVAALVATLDEKTQALEVAEAELREVRGGKVSSDSHREELQVRLAALGKEKSEVEVELRQVQERLAEALDEREGLHAQVRAAHERAEAAGLGAEALRQQLRASQKEVEERERALADAVAALDAKEAEAEELRRAAVSGGERNGLIAGQVQALQAQLAAAKEDAAAKTASLAEVTAAMAAVEQEAADKARAADEATAALRAAQDAIDRSRNHGSTEIAQLQEFLSKANARCEELEAEIESRDADLARVTAKVAQLEGMLHQADGLHQKVLEGENALRVAASDTAIVAQDLEEARAALADRQIELESARAAVGEKDRRITGLEMDLRQSQAAIAMLEAQLQDRDDRMTEQEQRLSALVLEVSDLKTELRTAEMARQDLQRDLDAARLEALHSASEARRLEGEVEAGQRRMWALRDDLEEARAPLMADQAIKRQVTELSEELAAERAAHSNTKKLLVAEAAVTAVPVAAALAVASAGPAESVDAELAGLRLADADSQLAVNEEEAAAPAAAAAVAQQPEVAEEVAAAAVEEQEQEEEAADETGPAVEAEEEAAQIAAPEAGACAEEEHEAEEEEEVAQEAASEEDKELEVAPGAAAGDEEAEEEQLAASAAKERQEEEMAVADEEEQ